MNSSTFLSIFLPRNIEAKFFKWSCSCFSMHEFVCFPLATLSHLCSTKQGVLFFRTVCSLRMAAEESCCSSELWSWVVYPSWGNMRYKFFPEQQLSAAQVPLYSIAHSCELLTMAAKDSFLSRPFQKGSSFPISCSAVLTIFREIKWCAHFCLGLLHFPRSISSYTSLALTKMMRNVYHFTLPFSLSHSHTNTHIDVFKETA